ncbi:MAG: SDR family NAD(P)-dependent oxidoreductase [Bacteroidia bacterium]|nr:SDR family NAD(P)-dependent oxidoreductase [Bacteroidia bacterium]
MEAIAIIEKRTWFRIREKLLKIKAEPKKVSLGYALGVFLGTTPFIGLKVFIALIITSILKWNRVSSVIGVYHINLFTAPLFYGLAFIVGKWVLGTDVVFVFPDTVGFSAFWGAFTGNMIIFYSLLIGGIVLGVPMSVGAYYLSRFILREGRGSGRRAQGSELRVQGIVDKVLYTGIQHPESGIKLPSPPVFTLITGASSGLGKAMAIECASLGMNVILVALPGRNLDVLCDLLEKEYGIIARYYERDLTSSEVIREMVEDTLIRYRVNFLINNAGIGGTIPFDESSPEYLEQIIHLNITAVSLLTRLLISELKMHPKAWILNVSSMAAFSPFPYKTIYPASKAFVAHFSRSLGQELKETSVKVAVLHPGPILTNPDVIVRIIRQGSHGRRGLFPARILARMAIHGVRKGKRVMVPGFANKLNRLLMTSLPSEIIVPFLARVMTREISETRKLAA